MADQKISQLTDGTSFQAGDEAVVNRSGTNYKVDPTQFGSSIDVTGTITADGLTVDNTVYTVATFSRNSASNAGASIDLENSDGNIFNLASEGDEKFQVGYTPSGGAKATKLTVDSNGDVSFYEDTGTTAKFFWDASAESLGIGTTSPAELLHVVGGNIAVDSLSRKIGYITDATPANTGYIIPYDANGFLSVHSNFGTGGIKFHTGAANPERMRITSNGNVGIGTSSPSTLLNLESIDPRITLTDTTLAGNCNHVIRGADQFLLISADDGNTQGTSSLRFNVDGSEAMRIDSSGNLLVGGTGTPTSSAGNLVLFNGTAPTGNATDGVILYAEDVSTSSELKVRDEAGNVTTLSPHNFDLIPEGPSEDMAWSYYSERDGKRINVDMLKAIRLLEQLSGEKLVHIV